MSSDFGSRLEKVKLAIVGCGGITEAVHLPVSVFSERVDVMALVDIALPRARQLADRFGVPVVVDDYRDLLGQVDAAIVALPPHLHAPVAIDLLRHGTHILVEKPMALTSGDCEEMTKAAQDSRAVLAVGLVRRFDSSSQFVQQAIASGMLGDIVSVAFCEGYVYEGPLQSDFRFRRDTGGGVQFDIGVHALDLLL